MAILKDLSQQQFGVKPEAIGLPRKPLDIRVSEKGAVSIYGLQRFPVTLYWEQWVKILENADQLSKFIAQNATSLTTKGV